MSISDRSLSPLRCPSCGGNFDRHGGELRCVDCSEVVATVDGIAQFPVEFEESDTSALFDRLSSIYETPMWFPVMYRLVGGPFAPIDDRSTVAGFLDVEGSDVLDVACGTGRFARYVADEAAFVWGIDTSDGMLETARRYADRDGLVNVAFARMDATDLQFDEGSFDAVACCWALHLFPDVPGTLAEIHRVLEPDGRFAGTTLSEDGFLAVPGAKRGLRQSVGARVFDAEDLRMTFHEAGFSAVSFDRRGAALFFSARE